MLSLSLMLVSILGVASAVPTPAKDCPKHFRNHVARYDNLTFTQGVANPIPASYEGLNYTTFQVGEGDTIKPKSGQKWAIAYGGTGNISIPTTNPNRRFHLHSFFFACDAGIPQPECTVDVYAEHKDGKMHKRTIHFPALESGKPAGHYKMHHVKFDGNFKELTSVGFSFGANKNGTTFNGGLALDNVKYTLHHDC